MSAHYNTLKTNLACILVAVGLALPAGLGIGYAAEQPSPEDIIRALKPAKITRGLTASPGDAARRAEEARFVNTLRNRPNSFAHDDRARADRIHRPEAAEHRSRSQLQVQLRCDRTESDPAGHSARPGALESRTERRHLHRRRTYRRQGRRCLQSGPVRAPRRCGQAFPAGEIWDRGGQPGDGRLRQDPVEESIGSARGRQSPGSGHQHERQIKGRTHAGPTRPAIAGFILR